MNRNDQLIKTILTLHRPQQHNNMTTTETTTETTTAPATTTTQANTLVVSPEVKSFVVRTGEEFKAPGKTPGKMKNASEREIGNAILAFIERTRLVEVREVDDTGNERVELVDEFALEMKRELALRATTERNTAKVENATLKEQLKTALAEHAILKARLAEITGHDSNPY